ncbi:MAG: DUF2294 domain-containing protein [bacterium]|nr:DUF2294 domain-containing protein [bacterium]
MEAEISRRLIQFEKEHMGRGPENARTRIFEDVIFVRLSGVLTPAEKRLAREQDGARLIKEVRLRLMDSSRKALEDLVLDATGCKMVSLHTDLSTRTGERILVFVLDRNIEATLSRRRRQEGP